MRPRGPISHIGKEANRWEEGLVHDLGEVVNNYGQVADPWVTEVLPIIWMIPTAELAELLAVNWKTVQRTKLGVTVPHRKDRSRWEQAARGWVERVDIGAEGGRNHDLGPRTG